jgi:hypothetical protein
VLQLYGRRTLTDSQIKKGAAKHIYLPSPLTGIWNDQVLRASSEVILCEALIDAMMFWCAGYSNVEHPGVAGGACEHASGGAAGAGRRSGAAGQPGRLAQSR